MKKYTLLVLLVSVAAVSASSYGDSHANCLKPRICKRCSRYERYSGFRTVDGHCNNVRYTSWGAAHIPLRRFLRPAYADKYRKDVPRGYPGIGPVLPPANLVSATCFQVTSKNKGNRRQLSTLFMTFGQFLDHDITEVPSGKCNIKSCPRRSSFRYPCFPILFTNDHKASTRCTPFARSKPVCRRHRGHARQQMNEISSLVDGSNIYSAEKKQFEDLRKEGGTGELKISSKGLLPFDPKIKNCKTKGGCSLVGDKRGDENIALLSMHTLWVREHNRIARKLKQMNPHWQREKIFQMARKINVAQYQHIIFKEWLPHLIRSNRYRGYNRWINPGMSNAFSTAAFRFGHSLIPNSFSRLNKNFDKAHEPILLQEAFNNRKSINAYGIEPVMFGLCGNQSHEVDTTFAHSIARKLFVEVGKQGHVDLTALNIQRGRDHGLPTYGAYRRLCRLRPIRTWRQLEKYMPVKAIKGFKKLYKKPYDIDLYAAGIAEKHVRRKQVGPTFECIIRKQFRRLQDGDRFYYRARGMFTRSQRRSLYRVRMSSIICNNLKGIVSLQKHAFFAASRRNRRISCDRIPKLDLEAFREHKHGGYWHFHDESDKEDEGESIYYNDEKKPTPASGLVSEPDYNPESEEGEASLELLEDVTDRSEDETEKYDSPPQTTTGETTTTDGEVTAIDEYNIDGKEENETKDAVKKKSLLEQLEDESNW